MITCRVGNQNDLQSISEILIDTWKKCYASFIPSEFLNNLNLEKQIQRHSHFMQSNITYYVAENENKEVIGFASYGINRIEKINCKNELYTIYVSMNHQRQGIGKMLIGLVFADIKKSNSQILVSVFEKNPWKDFYISHGFQVIDKETIHMVEFQLEAEILISDI